MIQRIQTLYLVIADLLVSLLFFFPLASLTGKGGALYQFELMEFVQLTKPQSIIKSNGLLVSLSILAILLITVVIFLYKDRQRQLLLTVSAIFILLLTDLLVFYYAYGGQVVVGEKFSINLSAVLPLIAIIFLLLAITGIRKDEALVKSIDRIR